MTPAAPAPSPAGSPTPSPVLLSEQETRERILSQIVPLPIISVPLLGALGRFTAHEGRAVQSLPGFDNSSMDGYAVTWPAGDNAPLPIGTRLAVQGVQPAGVSLGLRVLPGQAVRIFTGAPIPEGTGTVVMQEDVERSGDEIILQSAAEPGEYIRRAGADLARGQKMFEAGEKLTAQRLGLLASQGLAEVEICRPPRVAILATGDELRPPGEPLGPGEIHESNSILLAALAAPLGATVTILPRAADERADVDAKLATGLRDYDVLIVAGGVSVGERDLVKERLAAAGVRLDLWRVAIQPGKPFLYGHKRKAEGGRWKVEGGGETEAEAGAKLEAGNKTHVFGLPGNPVSAFVTFLLFVRPALLKLMGASESEWPLPGFTAVAGEALSNRGNRPHFLRGRLDDQGRFFLGGRQESHALFGLSQSHALVRVEPGTTVAPGEAVRALMWSV